MSNRYEQNSRLTDEQFKAILERIAAAESVNGIADALDVGRESVGRRITAVRERIDCIYERNTPFNDEIIRINRQYFDKDKDNDDVAFGLIVRNGRVYVQIACNCSYSQLLQLAEERKNAVTIPRDVEGIHTYDAVANSTFGEHVVITRNKETDHTEQLQKFCNCAQKIFDRRRSVSYELTIKECEFLFNEDLPVQRLLDEFENEPLCLSE